MHCFCLILPKNGQCTIKFLLIGVPVFVKCSSLPQIMDHGPQLSWDDIAGLEFAKKTIKEIVVWPMLRP